MAHNWDHQVQSFLKGHGWANSQSETLASDASLRQYFRLKKGSKSAVLMDARSTSQQETQRFCDIADLLKKYGLYPPEIFARNTNIGLLLVEDFGDDVFARIMERDPSKIRPLYKTSLQMLLHLRRVPVPEWLTQPCSNELAQMISPFFEYYLNKDTMKNGVRQIITKSLECSLTVLNNGPRVVALRDCHAENLMQVSGKFGLDAVGVLDFQDAFSCHPAYDLVSFLQDARRDVPADIEQEMLDYYLSQSQDDSEPFLMSYRMLGLQRNLRILGIFSALAIQKGKVQYLDLQPRVCEYALRNLADPVFDSLRPDLLPLLTDLTAQALQRGSDG
jgi:aminoglycoside/choline kinase family phosphotransferase